RWECRWPAHGCSHQYAARVIQGSAVTRALRRRALHNAGSQLAADGGRIRRVGQSQPQAVLSIYATVLALRQYHTPGLSGDTRQNFAQRQPGDVLGAGEIRRQAARAENRYPSAATGHQYGSGPRRRLRALRLPARDRVRFRLCARSARDTGLAMLGRFFFLRCYGLAYGGSRGLRRGGTGRYLVEKNTVPLAL